MSRNIVLLSDGTGNSSAKVFKTNVWRLFQILDLRDPNCQVAYYDDGVGTSSFKLFAILGGVFGFGLKRNVIDIYSFCCRNYRPGDRIYCFGFSRGAFTIRIVAGMIARQGLVSYDNDEANLARFAADAYRLYRRRFTGGIVKYLGHVGIDVRGLRDRLIQGWRRLTRQPVSAPPATIIDSIHFVGLWDTVDAYGGPIEEMTRAIDYWIWPLSMPDRFMNAKVHKACHALALEDERDAFRPVIWDQRYVRASQAVEGRKKTEWLFDINYQAPSATGKPLEIPPHARVDLAPIDRERISQVWFTGVHSDIGGGYPQDGLSYVTLDWMLDRAKAYGLIYFDTQRSLLLDPEIGTFDKLNDSRKGLAGYYRYKPRNIADIYSAPPYKPSLRSDLSHIRTLLSRGADPQLEIRADLHPDMPANVAPPPQATIHQSVFDRIASGTDRYAPVVIPASYHVTDKAGAVVHARAPIDPGPARSHVQDDAWNLVWLRRVVYFLTALATLFVAAIPFLVIYVPGAGRGLVGGFVGPVVNAAAAFLPAFLQPWFDAFRNAPGLVLGGVIVVLTQISAGAMLQQTIRDVMRTAWHAPAQYPPPSAWRGLVYALRRQGWYQVSFYVLKNWIFPTGIMFWLFLWLAFGTANTLGLICKGKGGIEVTAAPVSGVQPIQTANVCNATGLKVTHGETYRIELTLRTPWLDRTIATDPNGFGSHKASWLQTMGVPYRRLIFSNWFATIVRVGGPGLEEHVPEWTPVAADVWTASVEARSDGELFVYVNDTAIGLPWIYNAFYRNNQGTADIRMWKTSSP